MEYESENNVVFVSTALQPADRLTLTLGLSFVKSTAGMMRISMDPIGQEASDGLPHEDYGFGQVHTYSDLDLSRLEATGELEVAFNERVGMTLGLLYDDYSDDSPYLEDLTGISLWAWTGLRVFF